MHIKQLNDRENTAYSCLEDLKLTEVFIPYRRNGNCLYSETGTKIFHNDIDIPKLYEDCLRSLYAVKTDRFSPGIYSFYKSTDPAADNETYGSHLLHQVRSIVTPSLLQGDPVLELFGQHFFAGVQKHGQTLDSIHEFSLLHGDLYSQNILVFNGRYRLIDPEYLRFGPPSLELAFLICWDSFCGDSPLPEHGNFYADISSPKKKGIITEEESMLISEVFIPMFAFLSQAACKTGLFREPQSILSSLSKLASLWQDPQ